MSRLSRSTKSSGFSVVELLCVITIICLLAAILFPVFSRAKERAGERSCMQNLKSLHTAISLYRSEYEGAEQGTASQMGFPHIFAYMDIHGPAYRCSAAPNAVFSARYPYYFIAKDPLRGPTDRFQWKDYVERQGNSAYILADVNHNPRNRPSASPHFTTRATAVTIDGTAKVIEKRADWQDLSGNFWK